jgi:uncharacterized repeat protein (TIGR01451 family)
MRRLVLPSLILLAALAGALSAKAEPAAVALPDFDQRPKRAVAGSALTGEQSAGAARLKALLPDAQVDVDEQTGCPKWIISRRGTLSGAKGEGKSVSRKAAGQWPEQDPDRAVKAFLSEHQRLFRHGPEVLQGAVKKREFVTEHNGVRSTVWEQHLDGIPVHEAVFMAHVTRQGELVAVSSEFLPNPAAAAELENPKRKALQLQPPVSAEAAVVRAIENLGEKSPAEALVLRAVNPISPERRHTGQAAGLPGTLQASLVWLPFTADRLRLCWAVELTRRHRGEAFLVLVDAETSEVLVRRKLTFDLTEATYRVFTTESPSPMSPGWSQPSTNQPPLVARSLVTWAALSTNASPTGWIDDGANETRGNNVDAHLDRNGDNAPDLPRPQGSPFRVFDFPVDLTQGPETYMQAATVQLFFWCNWMHDQLYDLGFTEAAGNMQKDNFGRGGLGGDPILADAQDGSDYNNANFTPTRDGTSPRIQMFLFNGPTPNRDGDLDGSVILHEYTHGLSDRLVGGGVGLSQTKLQPAGMAEGWSDFYSLACLSNPNDPPGACYPVGAYASYLFSGLRENYYYGIRRYPVSTDLSKDPLTFKDIDPNQASFHLDVPRSPISTWNPSEAHKVGEVWCVTLWEVRDNLIHKYGADVGSQMILRLVTDAMKLSPPNPNFVQARNAILLADVVMNAGANANELWAGFAKRGLGYSAVAPDSTTTTGVQEAFDLPNSLTLSPTNTFVTSGNVGGPFTPSARTYSLRNGGASGVNWSVTSSPVWLTVTPSLGGLAPHGSNTVVVTINSLADSLPAGTYSSSVVFANQGGAQSLAAPVLLQITDAPGGTTNFLNEIFNGGFDLDYTTLIFTPSGGSNASSYTVCSVPTAAFPTDPTSGQTIPTADDAYTLISLSEGKEVSLYGTRTNKVLIGSNGDLVLDVPIQYQLDPTGQYYSNYFYSDDNVYFQQPRVAPLYVDLNPSAGGSISWEQLPDRLAVSWQNVPEYGFANGNNFQVEWFFDGTIRFTYAGIAPGIGANYSTPKVGLVQGGGLPPGFASTDFSLEHSCLPHMSVLLPSEVTEGEGPWEGALVLGAPSDTSVTVSFSFSDAHAFTDPPFVEIPPGQVSARFLFDVQDDHRLRGTYPLSVTASAPGYGNAGTSVQVDDNETAALTVNIPPTARENQGLLTGRVSMDSVPDAPITVQLSSSDSTLVQVPLVVTIPAGTNTARFDMWIGDDHLIAGPVAVAVVAHVPNWQDDADAVIVADNESTNLFLTLPTEVAEDAGVMAKGGRVTLNGYPVTNLVVSLSSDNTNAVVVPATVTVLAGQSVATFDLNIIDDSQVTGTRTATVQASALGFSSSSAIIRVTDNELPSYPTNPSPAHLATRIGSEITLTWIVQPAGSSNLTFDVYCGTNPVPGQADFQGNAATNSWNLHRLAPGTTYSWQVVLKSGPTQVAGLVWQFTTASLDHFAISQISSPQLLQTPIPVAVSAIDQAGNVATGFNGSVGLTALTPANSSSTVVIAEVDTGSLNRVELANVSGQELNLSGWQIYLYDWSSWPGPQVILPIPEGSISAAGDLFQIRKSSLIPGLGIYPTFNLTNDLHWNSNPNENPVAVLVLDRASNVVDFVCAVDADPTQITVPLRIPAAQWIGVPVPANVNGAWTYQRIGAADHNGRSDWVAAPNSIGKTNQQMAVPFYELLSLGASPDQLAGFVNGVWVGGLTLQDPTTNVFLRVDDGLGHAGTGNVFAVSAADDVAVSLAVSPGRKTLSNPFNYLVTVTNTGVSAAKEVVLLDNLPSGADFVAASASQGSVTHLMNALICELGTIDGGMAATVTITVLPQAVGLLTNRAAVSRLEPEAYTADDTAVLVTPVSSSLLSVKNASLFQPNGGSTNLLFQVRLSEPCGRTITAGYATGDGTAIAGQDYQLSAGTVEFQPGATNATVPVVVYGTPWSGPNRNFYLYLSNAVNAIITQPVGTATISNQHTKPWVTVSDVTVVEGDQGVTNAVFQVSLSAPSGYEVGVQWATSNDTATAGVDYLPGSGRLVFSPGQTNLSITVPVLGNTVFQPDRGFYFFLTYPQNTVLARFWGRGTILDDDAWRLHHFTWSTMPPTQYVHEPFQVTITAQNALNQTVTDFGGPVTISASYSNRVSALGGGQNRWELPLGAYYHDARLQVIYPASDLATAGRITALALQVATPPGQVLSNWTVRLKHTPLGAYTTPNWETNWTLVYQSNQTLVSTGWTSFRFQTPFDYNGQDNLMVDFSFNNSSYSSDGFCRATTASQNRSIYFRSDSAFGDPLLWSGAANPAPLVSTQYPNVRFAFENPAAVTPLVITNLANGVWTGPIMFDEVGLTMVLHAIDAVEHTGDSASFDVMRRDSDGDGMPDEWEIAKKLDPFDPSDASLDPDGDDLTNLQEYLAGTDPHDALSAVKILSITPAASNLVAVTFSTVTNRHYLLEYVNGLGNGTWAPAATARDGTGDVITITNRIFRGDTSRFLRLKVTP